MVFSRGIFNKSEGGVVTEGLMAKKERCKISNGEVRGYYFWVVRGRSP